MGGHADHGSYLDDTEINPATGRRYATQAERTQRADELLREAVEMATAMRNAQADRIYVKVRSAARLYTACERENRAKELRGRAVILAGNYDEASEWVLRIANDLHAESWDRGWYLRHVHAEQHVNDAKTSWLSDRRHAEALVQRAIELHGTQSSRTAHADRCLDKALALLLRYDRQNAEEWLRIALMLDPEYTLVQEFIDTISVDMSLPKALQGSYIPAAETLARERTPVIGYSMPTSNVRESARDRTKYFLDRLPGGRRATQSIRGKMTGYENVLKWYNVLVSDVRDDYVLIKQTSGLEEDFTERDMYDASSLPRTIQDLLPPSLQERMLEALWLGVGKAGTTTDSAVRAHQHMMNSVLYVHAPRPQTWESQADFAADLLDFRKKEETRRASRGLPATTTGPSPHSLAQYDTQIRLEWDVHLNRGACAVFLPHPHLPVILEGYLTASMSGHDNYRAGRNPADIVPQSFECRYRDFVQWTDVFDIEHRPTVANSRYFGRDRQHQPYTFDGIANFEFVFQLEIVHWCTDDEPCRHHTETHKPYAQEGFMTSHVNYAPRWISPSPSTNRTVDDLMYSTDISAIPRVHAADPAFTLLELYQQQYQRLSRGGGNAYRQRVFEAFKDPRRPENYTKSAIPHSWKRESFRDAPLWLTIPNSNGEKVLFFEGLSLGAGVGRMAISAQDLNDPTHNIFFGAGSVIPGAMASATDYQGGPVRDQPRKEFAFLINRPYSEGTADIYNPRDPQTMVAMCKQVTTPTRDRFRDKHRNPEAFKRPARYDREDGELKEGPGRRDDELPLKLRIAWEETQTYREAFWHNIELTLDGHRRWPVSQVNRQIGVPPNAVKTWRWPATDSTGETKWPTQQSEQEEKRLREERVTSADRVVSAGSTDARCPLDRMRDFMINPALYLTVPSET